MKGDLLNGVVGNREFSKFRRARCYHAGTHVALYRMCVVTEDRGDGVGDRYRIVKVEVR